MKTATKVALTLAVIASAVAFADWRVKQGGSVVGTANEVNCSGAASCTVSAKTMTVSAPSDTRVPDLTCAAGQYANKHTYAGGSTCAQVQTSQLGGTVTDAQLASSYSGVGACAAGSVVSAVNDNGAPTCVDNNAVVGGTCAVGDVVTAISTTGAPTCAKPITGGSCAANNFVNSVSTTGAVTCGAPAIVGGTCAAGSYMTGINSRGEITCANTCPSGCV